MRLPCRVTRTPATSSGAQAGKLTLITVFFGTPASITLRRIGGPNFSAVSHSGALRVSMLNSCDSANDGIPRMVPSSAPAMVPE